MLSTRPVVGKIGSQQFQTIFLTGTAAYAIALLALAGLCQMDEPKCWVPTVGDQVLSRTLWGRLADSMSGASSLLVAGPCCYYSVTAN
jgi:hypothetical protein